MNEGVRRNAKGEQSVHWAMQFTTCPCALGTKYVQNGSEKGTVGMKALPILMSKMY